MFKHLKLGGDYQLIKVASIPTLKYSDGKIMLCIRLNRLKQDQMTNYAFLYYFSKGGGCRFVPRYYC